MKTIRTKERKYNAIMATNFEVVADDTPAGCECEPTLAILVHTDKTQGDSFAIPMDMEAARELGRMLLSVVLRAAPGVALAPYLTGNSPEKKRLREKLATEGITYEDMKAIKGFFPA
jgi:hypothetical protein